MAETTKKDDFEWHISEKGSRRIVTSSVLAYWTLGSSLNPRSDIKTQKYENISLATSFQQISGKNSESK